MPNFTRDLVSYPSDWNLDDRRWADAVVRNAVRLLDDAALLAQYQRFGTAFTLSILALEEVGKIVLKTFDAAPNVDGLRGRSNIHIRKQLAGTALLQAEAGDVAMREKLKSWGLGIDDPRRAEQHAELREALALAIASSKENRLLTYVRLGATERLKHAGIYVDDWHFDHGVEAGRLSAPEYHDAQLEARRAIRLLADPFMLRIAKVIFDLELLQPHISPSAKLPPRTTAGG